MTTTQLLVLPFKNLGGARRRKGWLLAIEVIVPVLLLAWWWIASADSTNPFFPPLAQILTSFRELWLFDHFLSDIVPSLTNLLIGFLIALVAGVTLGVLLGSFRPLRYLADPLINFWRAIPPVALVPIFVSMFGFGNETRVISIATAAVFPIVLSTMDGIRGLDETRRDVVAVYQLTPFERVFRVNLLTAMPMIFSGIQVALMYAFVVMIASEMLGFSIGIGAITLESQQTFRMADMWAGVLLLGLIGYLVNLIFLGVRRVVLRWYLQSNKIGKQ